MRGWPLHASCFMLKEGMVVSLQRLFFFKPSSLNGASESASLCDQFRDPWFFMNRYVMWQVLSRSNITCIRWAWKTWSTSVAFSAKFLCLRASLVAFCLGGMCYSRSVLCQVLGSTNLHVKVHVELPAFRVSWRSACKCSWFTRAQGSLTWCIDVDLVLGARHIEVKSQWHCLVAVPPCHGICGLEKCQLSSSHVSGKWTLLLLNTKCCIACNPVVFTNSSWLK